jgi:hypothetical protein
VGGGYLPIKDVNMRDVPHCVDCRYYLNNGVAHCVNPRVEEAVEILVDKEGVHEMQLHFIRFTKEFCSIDGDWFEPKIRERDD